MKFLLGKVLVGFIIIFFNFFLIQNIFASSYDWVSMSGNCDIWSGKVASGPTTISFNLDKSQNPNLSWPVGVNTFGIGEVTTDSNGNFRIEAKSFIPTSVKRNIFGTNLETKITAYSHARAASDQYMWDGVNVPYVFNMGKCTASNTTPIGWVEYPTNYNDSDENSMCNYAVGWTCDLDVPYDQEILDGWPKNVVQVDFFDTTGDTDYYIGSTWANQDRYDSSNPNNLSELRAQCRNPVPPISVAIGNSGGSGNAYVGSESGNRIKVNRGFRYNFDDAPNASQLTSGTTIDLRDNRVHQIVAKAISKNVFGERMGGDASNLKVSSFAADQHTTTFNVGPCRPRPTATPTPTDRPTATPRPTSTPIPTATPIPGVSIYAKAIKAGTNTGISGITMTFASGVTGLTGDNGIAQGTLPSGGGFNLTAGSHSNYFDPNPNMLAGYTAGTNCTQANPCLFTYRLKCDGDTNGVLNNDDFNLWLKRYVGYDTSNVTNSKCSVVSNDIDLSDFNIWRNFSLLNL